MLRLWRVLLLNYHLLLTFQLLLPTSSIRLQYLQRGVAFIIAEHRVKRLIRILWIMV